MAGEPTAFRKWIYVMTAVGGLAAILLAYQFLYAYPIWTLRQRLKRQL